MAGQPNGSRDQQPRKPRYEDDVPPGGLAPAELLRDDIPHQVDDVVDRGLEQHRRERDGHPEQRGEHERSGIGHRSACAWALLMVDARDRRTREIVNSAPRPTEALRAGYVVTLTDTDGPLTLPAASRART